MIWLASWFAVMGIAPFAWPEHTVTDTWFPLDLLVHAIGTAYVLWWCWQVVRSALAVTPWRDVTFGDLWDARKRNRTRRRHLWLVYDDEKETP